MLLYIYIYIYIYTYEHIHIDMSISQCLLAYIHYDLFIPSYTRIHVHTQTYIAIYVLPVYNVHRTFIKAITPSHTLIHTITHTLIHTLTHNLIQSISYQHLILPSKASVKSTIKTTDGHIAGLSTSVMYP